MATPTIGEFTGFPPEAFTSYKTHAGEVIGDGPKELEDIGMRALDAGFEVGGSELTTGPRGYQKNHDRIALLRHKALTLSQSWPVHTWMHTREAYDRVTTLWRAAEAMNQWLQDHVGASSMERDGRPR